MRLLILLLSFFLTACAKETDYIEVRPQIAPDLLTPCAVSERRATTVNELAALAAEHLASARCANGKIEALAGSLLTGDGSM